jgi:hypothetical protein
MAVSVALEFVPPTDEDIVKLRILEAPAKTGPFVQIEETTAVGTYPTYINNYTTALATSKTDWFAIQWVDSKGAESPVSAAVQGGSSTLAGEIVNRVMLRDPTLDENVVMQEALASIEMYYKVDPTTVPLADASHAELSGLTLMTMARSYIFTSASSSQSGDQYVAGLVSQKAGSSSSSSGNLQDWIDWANKFLGTNYSVILLMEEIEIAGGTASIPSMDQSRLIVEIQ